MSKLSLFFIITLSIRLFSQEWQFLGLEGESISAIALDWSDSNIIYAGSLSSFSAGTVGGIFKSTNGGAIWDTLIRGVTVRDIDIHPKDPQIVYVTLGINSLTIPGVIKSFDGGGSWIKADSGITMNWEEGPGPLAIDHYRPDTLYCGTGGIFGGSFYKSTNGGIFWKDIGNDSLRDGVVAIALSPLNTDIILVSTAFRCFLFKSTNGGFTWQEIIPPWQDKGLVYSLQIDPINNNTIYACAGLFGFMKSNDAGFNWEKADSGFDGTSAKSIVINPKNPSDIYIGTYGNGIYFSNDFAVKWNEMNEGLNNKWIKNLTIRNDGNLLYAGTDNGVYKCRIDTCTKMIEEIIITNKEYILYQNYPNPFNSQTCITYKIPENTFVNVSVYSLEGKLVKVLKNEWQLKGQYQIFWDGLNEKNNIAASGVYIYRISTPIYNHSKKLIYLK